MHLCCTLRTLLCSSPVILTPLTVLLYSIHKLINLPYVEAWGEGQGAAFQLSHFNYIRVPSPHITPSHPLSSPLASLPPLLSLLFPPHVSTRMPPSSSPSAFALPIIPSFHLHPYSTMHPLVGNLLSWRWHVPCLYEKQQLHSPWIMHLRKFLSEAKRYITSLSIFLHFLFHSLRSLALFPLSLPFLSPAVYHSIFFCISLSAAYINLITPAWEERIIGT